MFSYASKRVLRSLGLFAALLLGVILASSFFAGVNIGADTTAKAALTQQLSSIPVDIVVSSNLILDSNVWEMAAAEAKQVKGLKNAEIMSRGYCYCFEAITSQEGASVLEGLFIWTVGISNDSRVYSLKPK